MRKTTTPAADAFRAAADALAVMEQQVNQNTADIKKILAGGVTPPQPQPPVGPLYPAFDPFSFWYAEFPAGVQLHPDSAAFTENFCGQARNGVGCNVYQYTATLFNPLPADAPIRVAPFDCFALGWNLPGLDEMWKAVPWPDAAQPSPGTDQEMTIYDANTDSLYEFWQLQQQSNGSWQACRGGRMENVSRNPGMWTGGGGFGAAATGLPFAPGQVRVSELQQGHINHVIGLALGWAENWDIFSWPAQRSDGWNPDGLPHQIPEGLRCRLEPSIDVTRLGLHPVAVTIAKAAQRFGFVVWDKTGSTPSLRFENALSRTAIGEPDPYPALFEGTPEWQLLAGFPWDRLQWMPMHYGMPAGTRQPAPQPPCLTARRNRAR